MNALAVRTLRDARYRYLAGTDATNGMTPIL